MRRRRAEQTTRLGPGSSRPGSFLTQREADQTESRAYRLPVHVDAGQVYERLFASIDDPFFRDIQDIYDRPRIGYTHY